MPEISWAWQAQGGPACLLSLPAVAGERFQSSDLPVLVAVATVAEDDGNLLLAKRD
jgi:hypothetical protein